MNIKFKTIIIIHSKKLNLTSLYKPFMYNFFRKKTPMLENSKSPIHEYYSIKEKLELPLKIKLFL